MKNQNEPPETENNRKEALLLIGGAIVLIVLVCILANSRAGKAMINLAEVMSKLEGI